MNHLDAAIKLPGLCAPSKKSVVDVLNESCWARPAQRHVVRPSTTGSGRIPSDGEGSNPSMQAHMWRARAALERCHSPSSPNLTVVGNGFNSAKLLTPASSATRASIVDASRSD